jgi:hypothetical protein
MERSCGMTMVVFTERLHGQLSGSRSWKPIQHSLLLDLNPSVRTKHTQYNKKSNIAQVVFWSLAQLTAVTLVP